jgi:proteasome lid subunit RPN8/RPN11
MLQGLVSSASRLLLELQRSFLGTGSPGRTATGPGPYTPLRRMLLTDGVGRTLFEGYAQHRASTRGDDETGWVLLGLREATEVVVLATLPAGARSDAGVAHVRFNSNAQALASRIVRQADRRLTILGVVHTHPGSLRHPSEGDLRGDGQWVGHLRGKEGVFGIGTADAAPTPGLFAYQPRPHVQCLGELRFSWYALRHGDRGYRPLPVELTIGPDLARNLHLIWPTLEVHAERIDRLYRQQTGMRFEVVSGDREPGLVLTLPLASPGEAVRVLLRAEEVRYYLEREGELMEVDHQDDYVDRGVYLLLAELAARA